MSNVKEFAPIGGEHGVSCFLPTLQDIIEFEEQTISLNRGYPRFVTHPAVTQLLNKHKGEFKVAVSSLQAAKYCLQNFCVLPNLSLEEADGYAVIHASDKKSFEILFGDARNAGMTLSSRKAARILANQSLSDDPKIFINVIKKICDYEKGSDPNLAWLFPSGMGAIFSLLMTTFTSEKPHIIMVGSPYVDSRHILEKMPSRKNLPKTTFIDADQDPTPYITEKTGLIFLELPTNPLIRVPDLEKIVQTAHAHNLPVAVDSTIASPYNCNPFRYGADVVIHSTTKFLNGKNDHLGGILLLNPNSQFDLKAKIKNFVAKTDCNMDQEEAAVLLKNLDGFPTRMEAINSNTLQVAQFLEQHTKIERVYYPGLKNHPDHAVAQNLLRPGASGLLSFVLKNSCLETARAFYDNCTLPGKGPSLGSEQTLLCPITMLSFYHETPEALQKIGQDLYTMRVSVGTEQHKETINHLAKGLNAIKTSHNP